MNSEFAPVFQWGHVLLVVQITCFHGFSSVLKYPFQFPRKIMFGSSLLLFVHVLFMYIYVYLCPTQFSYDMTLVALTHGAHEIRYLLFYYSNRTSARSGAGTPYISPISQSFLVFVLLSLVFCVLFCRASFVLLSFDLRLLITHLYTFL